MRVFYTSQEGLSQESSRFSLRDLASFFNYFLPERVILEDTKQVAIREGAFGNNILTAYYIFKGYDVWKNK